MFEHVLRQSSTSLNFQFEFQLGLSLEKSRLRGLKEPILQRLKSLN